MNVRVLAGNTTLLLVSDILCKLLVAVYTVLIVRYLGAQGFGVLSLGFAYMGIFALLADLGLNAIMVRELARDIVAGKKIFGVINVLKLIAMGLGGGALLLCNFFLGYSHETSWVILLCFAGMGFGAFWMSCSSVFQSQGAMGYVAVGQILDAILVLGGFPLVIYGRLQVMGVASLLLAANVVTLLYGVLICQKRFIPIQFSFDKTLVAYLARQVAPLSVCFLCASVSTRIGPVLLSAVVKDSASEIGWYSSAMKFVIAFGAIPAALSTALLPFWSKQFQKGNEKRMWDQLAPVLLKYLAVAGFFCGIYLCVYRMPLIRFFFGSDYEPAGSVLLVLCAGIPLSFVLAIVAPFLIAIHRQQILGYVAGASLFLLVISNLILMPHFQHQAIAIASVLTDGICLVFWAAYFLKQGFRFSMRECLLKPLGAAVLLAALFFLFLQARTQWWNGLLIGMIAYAVFLLSLRVFSIPEFKKIYRIWVKGQE